jgi:hypothetical protein
MTVQLEGDNRVEECVTHVRRLADGTLQVDFRWTAYLQPGVPVRIYPAHESENMYLTDERGNRYDALQVRGGAASETILYDGQSQTGWFVFPPLAEGARVVVFHDDDQGVMTEGITLGP